MIKITNLQEMSCITNVALQIHIREKAETMMQEYQVENLDDIGGFVILEQEEFTNFPISEMEFVEVLFLEKVCFYMVSESLATAMAKTSICLLGW